MKTSLFRVFLALILPAVCFAGGDTIQIGSEKHTGTFYRYKNGRFVFRTDSGTTLKEKDTKITSLRLEEPREVSFVRAGRKKAETGNLLGYVGFKFVVEREGTKQRLFPMHLESMEVKIPRGGQEGGTKGTGPIPPVDVGPLEDRSDLTAAETAALNRYKQARSQYDSFLEESTQLVRQMDAASGRTREELMNKLRLRKGEEQPLKRTLEAAQAALFKHFPRLRDGGTIQPQGPGPEPEQIEQGQIEMTIHIPELAKNQVLLLDVSPLKQAHGLSPAQSEALEAYSSAKENYDRILAEHARLVNKLNNSSGEERKALMGEYAKNGEKEAKSKQDVFEAQAALLKAFPGLKLTGPGADTFKNSTKKNGE
ncbi:MAG: hypothetical protein R6V03_09800 [Kiritimatiellia bacterium]